MTAYPLVPNRWLVIRYNGDPANRTAAAWVVESDYLDQNKGTSAYIDPNSTGALQTTLIGRKVDISGWSETDSAGLFLTAVGTGDITFSAYQPYVENVFSMHDPLAGVADQDTLSYMVAGWYSDPSKDILSSVTDAGSFLQKLNDLNWTVDSTNPPPCTVSLYHGLCHSIRWNKTGPIPQSDRPADISTVSLAVGNTSIDALTALIQKQAADARKSDSIDSQLLEAFQYNLLPVLDQPNGPDLLYQAIHKAWFGAYKGGYEWAIVKTSEDQSDSSPQSPYPGSPIDWTDPNLEPQWLAALNQNQAKYDEELRTMYSMQWKLYRLWWTKGRFDNVGANNQKLLQGYDPDFSDSNFDNQLDATQANSTAQLTQKQAQTVAALLQNIPNGNTLDELQKSIQKYAEKNNLPEGYELKRYARDSFYKANDPVVLISGAKAADILYDGDPLSCRFATELITGLTYNSKPVDVASMNGKIPAVDLSKAPGETASLLNEFFFLDPNNAAMIATIALNDASPATISALAARISEHEDETGTLPDLDLEPWTQPWAPLFLLWTALYYPIDHDTNGAANWTFDGQDYALSDTYSPLASPQHIALSGTTLLTPQSSFNFQKRLDDYRKKHPGLDADELQALEDFITSIDDWDFLSQTLDGFMFQLACQDNESNVIPAASSAMGQLIGSSNSMVPALGQAPQPFEGWPASGFQQYRSGQFCFEKLMVVDRFGQSVELATSQTYLRIKPVIAPDMTPVKTVLPEEPYRFMQLSPRLLQPARLNFDFVSAVDDTKVINLNSGINPVCAWVLPNHIDQSLACFDPDGAYLGELDVVTNDKAEKIVNWEFAPNSTYTSLQQLTADFPHLGQMLSAVMAKGSDAFDNFYQVIDETLWVVDPLGSRDDQNLSVLVGRPLALARARLQYELDGPPLTDPSWQYVFKDAAPGFIDYTFSVRLGELKLRNDGLIGYFTGSDYGQFNSVHMPSDGTYTPTAPPYVVQIGQGNFIDLTFQDSSDSYITMLVDPRASVHATTSILPTSILNLPAKYVDPALNSMEAIFHAGPLLSGIVSEKTSEGNSADAVSVLLPKPAEQNGVWSWLAQEGSAWNSYPIKQPDAKANFSNAQSILRTGMLKLSGAIKKGE